jgi:arylsulfatase A-like enzyme
MTIPRQEGPNVLLLLTDDQRFDTIHAWGNEHISTPNIDRLAREGVSFRNAYIMGGTSSAVCMPSRAMLLTGRNLFRIEREGQEIPRAHRMFGETFAAAGYETFGTGKWHNGTHAYARNFTDGAEIFFGGMDDHWNVPACDFHPDGRYPAPRPRHRYDGKQVTAFRRSYDHIVPEKHSSELFCDAAVDFLGHHRGSQPFFLYLSFMAPHDPRTTPEEYRRMYDPRKSPLPANFLPEHPFNIGWYGRDEQLEQTPRPEEAIRRHLADYYAMITHLDAQMGRVLTALEQSGRLANTIVVFASDNGLAIGSHGLMGKQSVYEHSVRVPLILAGPGIPRGEERDALCYLSDIYPTLCELGGLPVPDSVEGNSLVPAIRAGADMRDTLYFAHTHLHRGVRDERYKLIEYVVEGGRNTQLFDLHVDPEERNDLSSDPSRGDDLARLRRELLGWRADAGDTREKEAAFWQGYLRNES